MDYWKKRYLKQLDEENDFSSNNSMTVEEWNNLKVGDVVYRKGSFTPRKILEKRGNCIRLKKIKKSWTGGDYTVYSSSDKCQFKTGL